MIQLVYQSSGDTSTGSGRQDITWTSSVLTIAEIDWVTTTTRGSRTTPTVDTKFDSSESGATLLTGRGTELDSHQGVGDQVVAKSKPRVPVTNGGSRCSASNTGLLNVEDTKDSLLDRNGSGLGDGASRHHAEEGKDGEHECRVRSGRRGRRIAGRGLDGM